MKYSIITLFLLLTASPVFSQVNSISLQDSYSNQLDPIQKHITIMDNPCQDSLYLELKEIPLDEMSDRQFEIFSQKDKACQEYQNLVESLEPQHRSADAVDRSMDAMEIYYVVAAVSALASLFIIMTI